MFILDLSLIVRQQNHLVRGNRLISSRMTKYLCGSLRKWREGRRSSWYSRYVVCPASDLVVILSQLTLSEVTRASKREISAVRSVGLL